MSNGVAFTAAAGRESAEFITVSIHYAKVVEECFGEDEETSTRAACAPRSVTYGVLIGGNIRPYSDVLPRISK